MITGNSVEPYAEARCIDETAVIGSIRRTSVPGKTCKDF